MITLEKIRAAMDCADIKFAPFSSAELKHFDYCGVEVTFRRDGLVELSPSKCPNSGLWASFLEKLDFTDESSNEWGVSYTKHVTDEAEFLQLLRQISELVMAQPMKIVLVPDEFKDALSRFDTVLVRQGERTGRLYIIDPATGEWIVRTSRVMRTIFHADGFNAAFTENHVYCFTCF